MIGKNKIKRWRSALARWMLNWQKWNQPKASAKLDATQPLAMKRSSGTGNWQENQCQMQAIKGSYSENMDWDDKDKARFRELKARKQESACPAGEGGVTASSQAKFKSNSIEWPTPRDIFEPSAAGFILRWTCVHQ